MKASRLVLTAALLAAGNVRAQLLDPPGPPRLEAQVPAYTKPSSASFQAYSRTYMHNDTADPGAKLFEDYRTDPRLRFGFNLTPTLAIEAGYANLFSRGFHYVEYGRADERAGALGTKGFSSYVAGKYTVPVGDHFEAYGKLGVAYSGRKIHDKENPGFRAFAGDMGAYTSLGARYKLSDKASVSGEFEQHGDAAQKWGGATNATGVSAKLKLGF